MRLVRPGPGRCVGLEAFAHHAEYSIERRDGGRDHAALDLRDLPLARAGPARESSLVQAMPLAHLTDQSRCVHCSHCNSNMSSGQIPEGASPRAQSSCLTPVTWVWRERDGDVTHALCSAPRWR